MVESIDHIKKFIFPCVGYKNVRDTDIGRSLMIQGTVGSIMGNGDNNLFTYLGGCLGLEIFTSTVGFDKFHDTIVSNTVLRKCVIIISIVDVFGIILRVSVFGVH